MSYQLLLPLFTCLIISHPFDRNNIKFSVLIKVTYEWMMGSGLLASEKEILPHTRFDEMQISLPVVNCLLLIHLARFSRKDSMVFLIS